MDEYNYNQTNPWEPGKYETGRTRPPKNHRGLIAVLLVIVIFLSGLVSFLGLLNVKLFAQLKAMPEQEVNSVNFVSEAEEVQSTLAVLDPTAATEASFQTEPEPASFSLNPSPDSVPNVPQNTGLSLQDIYDKTIGSVVSITCSGYSGGSTGTGVIMTGSGYIVTNAHVVQGAQTVSVLLSDGRSFDAALVGADTISDLAVLHIEAEDLLPAEFGDSTVLRVGDSVVAIGDPLGIELRGTMTNGIVSAINRDISHNATTMTLIQTNAALNQGNSGGALINMHGQVVGITNLKMMSAYSSIEGIGFAIPSVSVKNVVDQLLDKGYVTGRPTIGITVGTMPETAINYYELPGTLIIESVTPGSDAEKQGLRSGDVIVSVEGQALQTSNMLKALRDGVGVGGTLHFVIYRSGEYIDVAVQVLDANQLE